jgi:predicted phosphodiesterase
MINKHATNLITAGRNMPSGKRLLTIVHISDLHFGDLSPNSDDADLDAVAESWWQLNRRFDGYLGHSGDALRHLNQSFKQIRDDEKPVMLLVTGDLTAVGSDAQFSLARRYLEATAQLSGQRYLGLQLANLLVNGAVPGNHDHWPGQRAVTPLSLVMFGASTGSLGTTFPNLPLAPVGLQRLPLTPRCHLSIGGIDTDAQVRSYGPKRFFARGHFVRALDRLKRLYITPAQNEIRVLLLHHSPQNTAFALGITGESRRALDDFVRENEISVLLTGHTHSPKGKVFQESRGGTRWDLLEARCGTTTQRDTTPWQPPRKLDENTLLVHRLYDVDSQQIEWRTSLFQRNVAGFEEKGPLRVEGRLPGDEGIVVWPRA